MSSSDGGDNNNSSGGQKFINWIRTHPGSVALIVIGAALVALVIYWIVDNWPIIQALGTAVTIAGSIGVLAFIVAGIVGIAAPALIGAYNALKAARAKNAEEAADKIKGGEDPDQAKADEAAANDAAIEPVKAFESTLNASSQASQSGQPSNLTTTHVDGTRVGFDNAEDAADGISDAVDAHGQIVNSGLGD